MKLLCSIFFFAYYNSSSANASLPLQVKMDTIQPYSIKIVRSNANTSGYEIYSGKKLFIRQLTIPGMPGNKGFEKKSDAEKVAKLVASKVSKGIMPPTIEKKEMDSLHVKY